METHTETHDDSYELFRRAVAERDAEAWAGIAHRYRALLVMWVSRYPARGATQECNEDLADWALARAWAALSPERFAAFPSTAALLGYLRACVTATVIDAIRAQAVLDRATRFGTRDVVQAAEHDTIAQLGCAELWQLIGKLVVSEAEQVVLVERFVFDLPPRAILARHPALFADVSAIYASVRNLRERLRRNQELQRHYAEYLST